MASLLTSPARPRLQTARRRTGWAPTAFAALIALALAGAPSAGAEPNGPTPTSLGVDGNLASSARASASDDSPAHGLNDGRPASATDVGTSWITDADSPTPSVQLTWSKTQRMIAVQLVGASGTAAQVTTGTLTFSDGSSLSMGTLLPGSRTPTTVAFPVKSVHWVRLDITGVKGTGDVGIAEMRAYAKGATPVRPTSPSSDTLASTLVNPGCAGTNPASRTPGLIYVLCPITNTRVRGTRMISFVAPGLTNVEVEVWPGTPGTSTPEIRTGRIDRRGRGYVLIPFNLVPGGPVTVQLMGVAGPHVAAATPTRLQLYNDSSTPTGPDVPMTSALGATRTLAYTDEFNSAISYSLEGRNPSADYPAAKPEFWGTGQFGDAIFPDPAKGFDNLKIVDGRYLRIATLPNPPGYTDPSHWGRQAVGGLLGSARPGGSGFAAQYGYFEARMMAPANPGTWPAFWMLPANNLVAYQPQVAEIDVIELYGHSPTTGCHAVHAYTNSVDRATVNCGRRFIDARHAAEWHVYGADVTPTDVTFYIDGVKTVTIPQVAGGDQPMFFMVNAVLGGGWPIKLGTVHNRSATYVDYVRVYV